MDNAKFDGDWWTDLGMKYEAAFGHDIVLREQIQHFISLLPSNSHILECGSGTGKPVALTVAESGHHIHGIDIAEGMVALARRQVPNGLFEVADMLTFEPKMQYHGIIASLSLFELSRKEVGTMVGKWFQWLVPEVGRLFIATFRAEDCTKQVKDGMWDMDRKCASGVPWRFMGQTPLITLFTRQGCRTLLEGVGFKISSTTEDHFVPAGGMDCDDSPRYVIAKKPATGISSDDEPRYYVIARKPGGG